jgi:hypothetical protein
MKKPRLIEDPFVRHLWHELAEAGLLVIDEKWDHAPAAKQKKFAGAVRKATAAAITPNKVIVARKKRAQDKAATATTRAKSNRKAAAKNGGGSETGNG